MGINLESANLINFEKKSITHWAADAHDVLLYMVGIGGLGSFRLDGTEVLNGEVLNQFHRATLQHLGGYVFKLLTVDQK